MSECVFDRNRPCDSRNRAKDRYTREQIQKIARRCGVKDVRKKSMTELCAEVRSYVQKRAQGVKECPPTNVKAYKPNYECNPRTGRWIKRKGTPEYFFRYELESFDENRLRRIAENLGIEVEEGEEESSIIHQILEKQYPLVRDPQRAKNIYVKKFKDALLKIYRHRLSRATPTSVQIRIFDASIKPQGTVRLLTQPRPLDFMSYTDTFTGYDNMMYRKHTVATDVDGLRRNEDWFATQKAYQMTLPFLKQLVILTYTHGGDAMIHAYLDGEFTIERTFVNDKYRASFVYPLFPVLIYVLTSRSHRREWIQTFKSSVVRMSPRDAENLLTMCGAYDEMYSPQRPVRRGDLIFKNYKQVVDKVFRQEAMDAAFYEMLMKEYVSLLKHVILDSPPLFHHLVVYKGVKSLAYMDFSDRNMYTNKRFISTTYNAKVATGSTFTNPRCCVQKITLLKGSRCLFPVLTYYSEHEILLPPGRMMYATSNVYIPKEGSKKQTINLVITN